jgi:hypothetical protein
MRLIGRPLRPLHRKVGRVRDGLPWAELLQRVFALDALRCPRCGARMRLLAAIEDPGIACRILKCLDLPARAPPLLPVAGGPAAPSEPGFGSDDPEWEFDQTLSEDEGFA